MIIGLVAGCPVETAKVIEQVSGLGMYVTAKWTLAEPDTNRMNSSKLRLGALKNIEVPPNRSLLLVSHLHFAEEAEFIRKKKGFVWHVQGKMSDKVPIHVDDLMVTAKSMASGAYYPVEEALHRCRLINVPGNKLPEPEVRWRIK